MKEPEHVYKCKNHGYLTIDEVIKCNDKSSLKGYRYRCNICIKEYRIGQYYANREENIKKASEWKKANREHINKKIQEDRIENPEKYKAWAANHRKIQGQRRNDYEVSRLRGLPLERYYKMIEEQNNRCAICNKEETRRAKSKSGKIARLCIDHDHTTGQVRALLCHNCNVVVGHSKEDISILEKTINYLKSHELLTTNNQGLPNE